MNHLLQAIFQIVVSDVLLGFLHIECRKVGHTAMKTASQRPKARGCRESAFVQLLPGRRVLVSELIAVLRHDSRLQKGQSHYFRHSLPQLLKVGGDVITEEIAPVPWAEVKASEYGICNKISACGGTPFSFRSHSRRKRPDERPADFRNHVSVFLRSQKHNMWIEHFAAEVPSESSLSPITHEIISVKGIDGDWITLKG